MQDSEKVSLSLEMSETNISCRFKEIVIKTKFRLMSLISQTFSSSVIVAFISFLMANIDFWRLATLK